MLRLSLLPSLGCGVCPWATAKRSCTVFNSSCLRGSSIVEGLRAPKEGPATCIGWPQLLGRRFHPSEVPLKVEWYLNWSWKVLLGAGCIYDPAKAKCWSWWGGRGKGGGLFSPQGKNPCELLGDIARWHQLPCGVVSELMSCGKIAFSGAAAACLRHHEESRCSPPVLSCWEGGFCRERDLAFSGRRISRRTALNREPSGGSSSELGPHTGHTKGR